jgi:hypothetical protein
MPKLILRHCDVQVSWYWFFDAAVAMLHRTVYSNTLISRFHCTGSARRVLVCDKGAQRSAGTGHWDGGFQYVGGGGVSERHGLIICHCADSG